MRSYISSILFLVVTLGALAYVASELSQFNTEISREMVLSFSGQ